MDEIEELKKKVSALESEIALIRKAIAAPPSRDNGVIPREEMAECEKYWLATLDHFGASRPIRPIDQRALFDLIKTNDAVSVMYAIYGMKYEQKTASFDPAYNVSLRRLYDDKLFEKFMNIGTKKRNEFKKKGA